VVEIAVSVPGIRSYNSSSITVLDNLLGREESTLQIGERLLFNFKSLLFVGKLLGFK
jgi:hypothetical protein